MLGRRSRAPQGPGRSNICVTWRLACLRERGWISADTRIPGDGRCRLLPAKTRVSSGEGVQETSSAWLVLCQWEPQNISTGSESLRVRPEALCAAGRSGAVMFAGGGGEGEEGTENHPNTESVMRCGVTE